MNGYRLPIHENIMKSITKSHRISLRSPSRPTRRQGRDENAIGAIEQAHDGPPPLTRRRTRRDDETTERDERGDKSSGDRMPANELKKQKKNTSMARQAQRDARRDEKRDEGRDGQ